MVKTLRCTEACTLPPCDLHWTFKHVHECGICFVTWRVFLINSEMERFGFWLLRDGMIRSLQKTPNPPPRLPTPRTFPEHIAFAPILRFSFKKAAEGARRSRTHPPRGRGEQTPRGGSTHGGGAKEERGAQEEAGWSHEGAFRRWRRRWRRPLRRWWRWCQGWWFPFRLNVVLFQYFCGRITFNGLAFKSLTRKSIAKQFSRVGCSVVYVSRGNNFVQKITSKHYTIQSDTRQNQNIQSRNGKNINYTLQPSLL